MEAILALEDGRVWRGRGFGAQAEVVGEIVFNTSMTGYQEIITDASYVGQIVAMTYPLIGNYGVNPEDVESRQVFIEGLVVRELSRTVSNWRATGSLAEYLRENKRPGISEVNTRSLVCHIRDRGAMCACLSTERMSEKAVVESARRAPKMVGRD